MAITINGIDEDLFKFNIKKETEEIIYAVNKIIKRTNRLITLDLLNEIQNAVWVDSRPIVRESLK